MKLKSRSILALAIIASLTGCQLGGVVKYKDTVVMMPGNVLGKQTVAQTTITTPDSVTINQSGLIQDGTSVVDAYKLAKSVDGVTKVLGDGASNLLTSSGEAIVGE